jgi:hypothetical protein
MIYFAHGLKLKMEDLLVVDVEKNPKVRDRYDPKGEGRYFLVTKDHRLDFLMNTEPEGSVQDIIERIKYENKIRFCK